MQQMRDSRAEQQEPQRPRMPQGFHAPVDSHRLRRRHELPMQEVLNTRQDGQGAFGAWLSFRLNAPVDEAVTPAD